MYPIFIRIQIGLIHLELKTENEISQLRLLFSAPCRGGTFKKTADGPPVLWSFLLMHREQAPCIKKKRPPQSSTAAVFLSGKRDSNSRPSAWEADALPTELFPHGRSHFCETDCKYSVFFLEMKFISEFFVRKNSTEEHRKLQVQT